MKAILQDIAARSAEVDITVQQAREYLGTISADLPDWNSGNGLALEAIFSRAATISNLATTIATLPEDRFLLAATNRLANLRDHLISLRDGFQRFQVSLTNITSWGGIDRSDSSGVIYTKSGNNLNVRSHLDELVSLEDNALEPYLVLAAATRPRNIGTFAAAARTLGQQVTEANKLLDALRSEINKISSTSDEINQKGGRVTETEQEVQRLKQEVETARRSADEHEQRILAATTAVEETRSKAAALDGEVSEYEDKFSNFQKLLDAREEALTKGNSELARLREELVQQQNEIAITLQGAKDMLGSATIAGLSSAYREEARKVNVQLNWARGGYYLSIAILITSVLAALNITNFWGLLHPLPGFPAFFLKTPSGTIAVPTGAIAVQILASLGSRALVILPALLLAGFATHRHAALFRLREEYNHKAVLAASVHGFKEQAPTYQEPIAAAVFQELLHNPASAMDGKATQSENGFVTRLLAPPVQVALKKLLELRDGPST